MIHHDICLTEVYKMHILHNLHDYKDFVCPNDVVETDVGPCFRLENYLTTVQHYLAISVFFGQFIFVHVTHIHVIAPPQGIIK